MKKQLSIMLALLLVLLLCQASVAEGNLDFTGYTLDELLEIRSDLIEEIARRPGGEKLSLGSGQYKIGEDLPAGVYSFRFLQNGDDDVSRTDYYVYENESMYRYDIDRLWLGDMPRVEGSFKGDGETRISLYPGEYLSLRYNGAEVARIGNVPERGNGYTAPDGTLIPKGTYTVGEEIPAGSYRIYFSGTTTSRVRVFQDAEEAGSIFNKGKETILDWNNTEGTVTLTEGYVLRVEYTSIMMTKGGGFTFD
ncbi:MAG: hypothetical protein IJ083_12230 [Clostridia bacterium]|nr:hypothetical protein [Clostridia bacterium]